MKKILILLFAIASISALSAQENFPRTIDIRAWEAGVTKAGHIQGVAIDAKHEYIYVSFTTVLVKLDLQGRVVGSVSGILGHLGCLEFNNEDGLLYGSLEYKNDIIGRGIMKQEGVSKQLKTGFYIAIFDVEKIDRIGMNAEKDGVMTTVLLKQVVKDYEAKVKTKSGETIEHRYACSGIDGVAFGPAFDGSGKNLLMVAYGIYGDTKRTDNDYQVLHQYDISKWAKYKAPLSQDNMHRKGPSKPQAQYFVYTGSTNYGVQNLNYDKERKLWLLACYPGKKTCFSNFTLFAVDGNKSPVTRPLYGVSYQKIGTTLQLWGGRTDRKNNEVRGWHNELGGAMGVCSLGNGYYYLATGGKTPQGRTARLQLVRFAGQRLMAFEKVQ